MATVTPDLVNGHNLEEVLGSFDVTGIYRVTGLVAAPHLQIIEAAETPGVPFLNDAYDPAWPTLLVVNREFVPDGPNAVRAAITFSTRRNVSSWNQPPPPTNDGQDVKQVSWSSKAIKVPFDRDGIGMLLSAPASVTGYPSYLSEADVFLPRGDLIFERIENAPPTARMRAMVGRVNQFSLGAYSANELLFRDLDATSTDGGNTWRTTYVFQFDSDRHRHRDSYHGPDGRVPSDAVEQVFDVILEADFSSLGLDFSDTQSPIT